ncbi:hypothetical protein SK128_014632 [Halocaridina rubra]|uniref:5-hydroxyisourate hydrolase n=1 Tax=Halocaridina rubra TaxID=373956 RepID=A0AAN9A5E2_HALRR
MSLPRSRIEVIQRHLLTGKEVIQVPAKSTMAGNPLTCHILDTSSGRPAGNMKISLHKLIGSSWQEVVKKITNHDGRAGQFLTQEEFTNGTYKMFFDTADYFKQHNTKGFYPYVEIVFEIENPSEHYHIPLLLSPYGYTTYRGS